MAYAHEGATGVVVARMVFMKDMARCMKAIGETLNEEVPFDAAAAWENAVALHENCHTVAGQVPVGSSHHDMTKASKGVWENPRNSRSAWTTSMKPWKTYWRALADGNQK